jgi:hypothetical protein
VAVAAETVATNRLYVESGHTLPHAEWTEAGPGREQVARRIGPSEFLVWWRNSKGVSSVEFFRMFKAKRMCRLATSIRQMLEGAEGHWAINVQAFIGKARKESSLFASRVP